MRSKPRATAFGMRRAADAESLLDEIQVDLIICDLMLPDASGLILCADLKKKADVPIIICSGTIRKDDRIIGFKLGADDFIAKPFELTDLLARVEASLRRAARFRPAPAAPPERERVGNLAVDRARCRVTVAGKEIALARLRRQRGQHRWSGKVGSNRRPKQKNLYAVFRPVAANVCCRGRRPASPSYCEPPSSKRGENDYGFSWSGAPGATVGTRDQRQAWANRKRDRLDGAKGGAAAIESRLELSVLTIAGIFFVLYRFAPHRHVRFGDIWPAALATAALWEATRRLLALYLEKNNMISGYGPVGAAMALLFWLYIASMIILIGAEI